jgi:hypothetical protein
MRRAIASGVIHGRGDQLVRPIVSCMITEYGVVVVKLKGEDEEIPAFNLNGAEMHPDELKGLSIPQARELRDKRLLS